MSVRRFQAGAQRVVDAVAMQNNFNAIESAEGADRFVAAAELGMQIDNHPHKETILRALRKRSEKSYSGLGLND